MATRETITPSHQFDSLEQERDAGLFGMWVFLVTEVMFFGGLFAAYAIYRYQYPAAFEEGSHHMNLWLGTINTAVLLTSSFTVVLAVHYAKLGNNRVVNRCLWGTVALAFGFLAIKSVEYTEKYHHGLMIGNFFTYPAESGQHLHLFLCLYFIMTGLHALHVIIGIGLMGWLSWKASRGQFHPDRYLAVEIVGLYWHFVDLIWVFLFPLFYLVGVR